MKKEWANIHDLNSLNNDQFKEFLRNDMTRNFRVVFFKKFNLLDVDK